MNNINVFKKINSFDVRKGCKVYDSFESYLSDLILTEDEWRTEIKTGAVLDITVYVKNDYGFIEPQELSDVNILEALKQASKNVRLASVGNVIELLSCFSVVLIESGCEIFIHFN